MEALDSEPCGVGIRGVAMAIDSVVWLALFMIAVSAVGAVTGQTVTTASGVETDLSGTPAAIGLGLWLALAIGYHTLAEWRYGKTLGKYLVSIRVVAADGTTPSFGGVLGRNVLRLVDWLPLFYLVGIVAMALSDGQRRLGDRVGDTAVVRT
ncbi:RDD family protein [Halorientalis pallida]|uniref:RDD family protein n=1 Tax=Halorientalis pallida TaxID=2479928 RepID=UPI003C6F72D3